MQIIMFLLFLILTLTKGTSLQQGVTGRNCFCNGNVELALALASTSSDML